MTAINCVREAENVHTKTRKSGGKRQRGKARERESKREKSGRKRKGEDARDGVLENNSKKPYFDNFYLLYFRAAYSSAMFYYQDKFRCLINICFGKRFVQKRSELCTQKQILWSV